MVEVYYFSQPIMTSILGAVIVVKFEKINNLISVIAFELKQCFEFLALLNYPSWIIH